MRVPCYGHYPIIDAPPHHEISESDAALVLSSLSEEAAFEEGATMCVLEMIDCVKGKHRG